MVEIYDRPGRDSGELFVSGSFVNWQSFSGSTSVSWNTTGGVSAIEFLRWTRLPEDGNEYSHTLRIITDPAGIAGRSNIAFAGTQGNDSIVAAQFASREAGWSEYYGNDGNDRMEGSNRTLPYCWAAMATTR